MGRLTGTLSMGDFSKSRPTVARNPRTTAADQSKQDGMQASSKWGEILYVQENDFSSIKEEARQYKDLLEDGLWKALEMENLNILRYAKNRLERIKRCVDDDVRERAIQGDEKSIKQAMRKLMFTAWEGPIVKFADQQLQYRLEREEPKHKDFILNCQKWVDENVLIMVQIGDNEGLRMATNQAHYKSLRTKKGQKSYMEATLGKNKQKEV
ncbi:hypothetical protein DCAR_0728272 [Daucus carota subsp. sativus]|uniref:Uncharacterized protein n=1 Tax=Daucus carota subsp. sativus TaxID=79200 RepID=A0A175YC12_DAUCS|nr:hypothetical protein DCAR_0728272 [Daucus carota subsp. sativus]